MIRQTGFLYTIYIKRSQLKSTELYVSLPVRGAPPSLFNVQRRTDCPLRHHYPCCFRNFAIYTAPAGVQRTVILPEQRQCFTSAVKHRIVRRLHPFPQSRKTSLRPLDGLCHLPVLHLGFKHSATSLRLWYGTYTVLHGADMRACARTPPHVTWITRESLTCLTWYLAPLRAHHNC